MERGLTLALVIPLLVAACGGEGDTDEFGLCSDSTEEEQQAMWDVYDAFTALGYVPTCCVVFVHDQDYSIGGTAWYNYRNSERTEPRNPSEGYRGMYRSGTRTVYIRRYGEAEPHLVSLLIHEIAHSVGFSHGDEMSEFERQVKEQMKK